jgi:tripartite-type tricarboxylate transporter receptor subunit TctC
VASALAQVRAGQLKAYGVMAKGRWPATPDTPTFDEAGVPGLHVYHPGKSGVCPGNPR